MGSSKRKAAAAAAVEPAPPAEEAEPLTPDQEEAKAKKGLDAAWKLVRQRRARLARVKAAQEAQRLAVMEQAIRVLVRGDLRAATLEALEAAGPSVKQRRLVASWLRFADAGHDAPPAEPSPPPAE